MTAREPKFCVPCWKFHSDTMNTFRVILIFAKYFCRFSLIFSLFVEYTKFHSPHLPSMLKFYCTLAEHAQTRTACSTRRRGTTDLQKIPHNLTGYLLKKNPVKNMADSTVSLSTVLWRVVINLSKRENAYVLMLLIIAPNPFYHTSLESACKSS